MLNKVKIIIMTEEILDIDTETYKNSWNISLNISFKSQKNIKMIGKNIMFNGNPKYYYQYTDITIVGYGRIYNESDLWTKIMNMRIPIVKCHPLVIVVELYKKFGIEKTIEYLDGDFSFVLFDMNLYGDESIIHVVRDSFGLSPLYQWVSNKNTGSSSSSQKRVQFHNDNIDTIQNQYFFSSSNYIQSNKNMLMEPVLNGTYIQFAHSFKVSANWKYKNTFYYYTLPFYSTYKDDDEEEEEYKTTPKDTENKIIEQVEIAVNKRVKYILDNENAFYIDNLSSENSLLEVCSEESKMFKKNLIENYIELQKKIKIGIIDYDNISNTSSMDLLPYLKKNEIKYNTKIECKLIDFVGKNLLELEEKYPNIIHQLKTSLHNKNDPSVIRAYFIPLMIAKHIKELNPDIKYVFMGDSFVYKWIFTEVFDRREELNNYVFQEKIKGWISAFFEYEIELIIPFLDRVLIQKV